MELIQEEQKKSTVDLFIHLMIIYMEFGGIKTIPVHVMNGKWVTPVTKVQLLAGHQTYKMLNALKV